MAVSNNLPQTGVWNPNSNSLPIIKENVTFAQFYVTSSGTYKELNLSFNAGDWLVYILDDNNSIHWYRTEGGVITVSTIGNTNAPESDWYTKVFINNNGSITDATVLEAEDLPPHKHSASDIDSVDDLIWPTVSKIFQNVKFGNVHFDIDDKLKKITAHIVVDEETIGTNEYGQLMSLVSGGSGEEINNFNGKIMISQVETLTDELAIIKQDITNLETYSKNNTFDVNRIPIDEQTITINKSGQLQATSMKNQPHTHTMSDIEDVPYFYNIEARNQNLSEKVDTDDTYLKISGFTIEAAFTQISTVLNNFNTNISELLKTAGKIIPAKPLDISYGSFTITNSSTTVVRKTTKEYKNVFYGPYINLQCNEGIFPLEGHIEIYIDNELADSIIIKENDIDITLSSGPVTHNNFVTWIEDAYKGNENYTGFYNKLYFTWSSKIAYPDGSHDIKVVHAYGLNRFESKVINGYFVSLIKELKIDEETKFDTNDSNISAIPCHHKKEIELKTKLTIPYKNDYIPYNFILCNGEYTTKITTTSIVIDAVKKVSGDGIHNLYVLLKDFNGTQIFLSNNDTENLRYDGTTSEDYRILLEKTEDTYKIIPYSGSVLDNGECVIMNSIMKVRNDNFSLSFNNGPDYRSNGLINDNYIGDSQIASFSIPCNDFINNFYIDIEDQYGNAFELNNDGTLKDLYIDASMTSSNSISNLMSTCLPYNGKSTWTDENHYALDLFRSSSKRKYITFGRKPLMNIGQLIVRFHLSNKTSLNIDKAIDSIIRSIKEQSE